MVEFGRDDLDQQLAGLDAVADVDLALADIAGGTGKDVGAGKG
jgi:hypothetical protein